MTPTTDNTPFTIGTGDQDREAILQDLEEVLASDGLEFCQDLFVFNLLAAERDKALDAFIRRNPTLFQSLSIDTIAGIHALLNDEEFTPWFNRYTIAHALDPRVVPCSRCDGFARLDTSRGLEGPKLITCPACAGTGIGTTL